jgi:hypothetical protein
MDKIKLEGEQNDRDIISIINQLDRIIKDNTHFYTDYLLVVKEMLKAYNKEEYIENFNESMLIKVKDRLWEIENK